LVDGTRTDVSQKITGSDALEYALATAAAFGVEVGETVGFDKEKAIADVRKP
jgi:hypothetical protein